MEDGTLHFVISERSTEFERRVTGSRDELSYWVFVSVTHGMAAAYELAHRVEGEDPRRQLFARQLDLLAQLNEAWRSRRLFHLGHLVDDVGIDVEAD